jgi:hypothetical protein
LSNTPLFEVKGRSLPKNVAHKVHSTLVSPDLRPAYKNLARTNTLAYFAAASVMKGKSFVTITTKGGGGQEVEKRQKEKKKKKCKF